MCPKFTIVPCSYYFSGIWVLVRIVGTVHSVDVDYCEFRDADVCFSSGLDNEEPAFDIPAYRSDCLNESFPEV